MAKVMKLSAAASHSHRCHPEVAAATEGPPINRMRHTSMRDPSLPLRMTALFLEKDMQDPKDY
jgi:hypothetical protein